jgi:predicted nucleotidyltransferase
MPDLKPNELEALRKLREALIRDFRLVELRLFGSKARGDSDPESESDIDVLIVLEELNREIRKQVSALCCDLSIDHHVVISPILYSLAEFTSGRTRITPFYQNVEREGVPYGRLRLR